MSSTGARRRAVFLLPHLQKDGVTTRAPEQAFPKCLNGIHNSRPKRIVKGGDSAPLDDPIPKPRYSVTDSFAKFVVVISEHAQNAFTRIVLELLEGLHRRKFLVAPRPIGDDLRLDKDPKIGSKAEQLARRKISEVCPQEVKQPPRILLWRPFRRQGLTRQIRTDNFEVVR
jgi:hypothetical protein